MRWLPLLACTGCFGGRFSAGPIFDSRGNVGADAALLISIDAPVADRTAIELSAGGGGGATHTDDGSVRPMGTVLGGLSVVHLDERFGIRAGALGLADFTQAGSLGGIGGWIGAPIVLSSHGERLFGSEEKGFGRAKSFTAIGPEFDLVYAAGQNLSGRAILSPRFVAEIKAWTFLGD